MRGKIAALDTGLQWRLAPSDDPLHLLQLEPFISDAATLERLEIADAALKAPPLGSLVTTNDGQAYINGCIAADVPIPPTIGVLDPNGTAGWRSLGFIPTGEQFIVGTPVLLLDGGGLRGVRLRRSGDGQRADGGCAGADPGPAERSPGRRIRVG
jgi:hypothetical protein